LNLGINHGFLEVMGSLRIEKIVLGFNLCFGILDGSLGVRSSLSESMASRQDLFCWVINSLTVLCLLKNFSIHPLLAVNSLS